MLINKVTEMSTDTIKVLQLTVSGLCGRTINSQLIEKVVAGIAQSVEKLCSGKICFPCSKNELTKTDAPAAFHGYYGRFYYNLILWCSVCVPH